MAQEETQRVLCPSGQVIDRVEQFRFPKRNTAPNFPMIVLTAEERAAVKKHAAPGEAHPAMHINACTLTSLYLHAFVCLHYMLKVHALQGLIRQQAAAEAGPTTWVCILRKQHLPNTKSLPDCSRYIPNGRPAAAGL